MLIKQGKDKGLNLGAAIDAARRFRSSGARRLGRTAPRAAARVRRSARRQEAREMMSIGAGKTIVVDGDELISISVCR